MSKSKSARKVQSATTTRKRRKAAERDEEIATQRASSKQADVIDMLRQPQGATISDVRRSNTVDWQGDAPQTPDTCEDLAHHGPGWNEPVVVKEGGKVRELKTLEAALYSLFSKAGRGDFRAQKELILLGDRVGVRWSPTSSIEVKFFEPDEYGRPVEVDMGFSAKPPSKAKGGRNRVPGSLLREQRRIGGALERGDEGTGHAPSVTTPTRNDASCGDRQVGYKRPPKTGQIKPGEVRNPYGRAGKHKRTRRTVDDLIEEFLLEKCTIVTGDLHSSMTRYEAIFRMMRNCSLKGNSAANRFLIEKARELHFIEAPPHHLIFNIEFVEAVDGKPKVYPPPPAAA